MNLVLPQGVKTQIKQTKGGTERWVTGRVIKSQFTLLHSARLP